MKLLSFKDFMKKHILKSDTMKESELQRIYRYPIYPRDSTIYSDKGIIKIDDGSQNCTHWCVFYIKDNTSHYFDGRCVQPDEFLLKQLPKPIIYHNYKIQDKNSKFCGSYCL